MQSTFNSSNNSSQFTMKQVELNSSSSSLSLRSVVCRKWKKKCFVECIRRSKKVQVVGHSSGKMVNKTNYAI